MKSIAEIFDNSKELLDSISNFMDKYIGPTLLRKCGITKIVSNVMPVFGMRSMRPLKCGKSGSFSRRIDEANRLVYEVSDDQIIVKSYRLTSKNGESKIAQTQYL